MINKMRIVKRILAGITVIMISLSIISTTISIRKKIEDRHIIESKHLTSLCLSEEQIRTHLIDLEIIADSVVEAIQTEMVSISKIPDLLEDIMISYPGLYELGIVFSSQEQKDNAPLFIRENGDVRKTQLSYDHTDSTLSDNINRDWYFKAMKNGKTWNEPYFGTGANAWLTELSIPFYLPKSDHSGPPSGVICVGYSMTDIISFMDTLSVSKGGYAFILSQEDYFLYYPQKEFITNHYNIDSLTKRMRGKKNFPKDSKQYLKILENGKILKKAARDARAGKKSSISYTSIVTDRPMVLYSEPIENIGWSLFSLVLESDLNKKTTRAVKCMMVSQIFITLTLLLILLLISRHYHLWNLGASGAVIILVVSIGFIWFQYFVNPPLKIEDELKLLNRLETHKSIQKFRVCQDQEDFLEIPTGIFIQTLEFNSANNFNVSGYIWQKYHKNIDTPIDTGVVFPEATTMKLERTYTYDFHDYTVVGWHFSGTIREPFNYQKYPFDKEQLWIRLWHKNFDKQVILVPDFTSYDRITPIFKPGLEESLILPEWKIERSYFSYNHNSYNSNFGIASYSGQVDFPELYFNIGISRNFFNALISHLIPLLIIYLMLYSVLHIARNEDEKGLFGFSALSGMRATTAMFLVAIFKHISLRNTLNATGVVYFEWFYFITYILILYVSINAIIIAQKKQWRFIQYHDNYCSRILFWPITFFLLFIVTVISFF